MLTVSTIGCAVPARAATRTVHSVLARVWDIPLAGLAQVLIAQPPGLAIGKVLLDDGNVKRTPPDRKGGHRETLGGFSGERQ